MFTGEIVGCVSQPRIFADPDAAHFKGHHARDLGYPESFTHQAHAHSIMSNSSSVAPFRAFSTSGSSPPDHVVVIHHERKNVRTGAVSPQGPKPIDLRDSIDRWNTAREQRAVREAKLRQERRRLVRLVGEAADEAAADPLRRRRRSVIRCKVATSLLVVTGMTAGVMAGALLHIEPLWAASPGVGFFAPLLWREGSNLRERTDDRQQRVNRAEGFLQREMKTVAQHQAKLINSRRALMVEQVKQGTGLPNELVDIVVAYRDPNGYPKQGRGDHSGSIRGPDGATAQATAATPAVDSKSHAAARPSADEGDGDRAEGRAQQRQRLLDDVPSADRSRSSLLETRERLRGAAIDQLGHPSQEVEAWLAEEATTIELLSKVNSWTKQLAASEWTETLACYCALHFGSYDEIPEALRSRSSVEAAMTAFADSLMRDLGQSHDTNRCSIS
jgi:hypothetical protein